MPIKVYELAKELKMSNTEMVSALSGMGYKGQTPLNELDDAAAQKVREAIGRKGGANGAAVKDAPASGDGDAIEVPENITIKDLADRLGVGANEIQKILMGMGVLAALNQRLAPDAVLRIAQKLGRTVKAQSAARPAAAASGPVAARPAAPKAAAPKARAAHGTAPRPPVVTIMGHVDHGKTTLLDAIRKTNVVEGEAGGITQHIGAYQVEVNGQRITFLDTPGHEAFSAMRARGAQVTDIVVIVVAANDSIMPQTVEAIEHAKAAGVPIMVAINKVDLPDANPDRVLSDLTVHELVPESYGGNVITTNVSAKRGDGIQDLLANILLVSEAEVDPKADLHGKAQGTVVEAKLDKGRGAVVTVLVQQGTLRVGDVVVAGTSYGKIRAMSDDRGNKVAKAGPSMPVEIVGFSEVPQAGDRLEVVKNEKEARATASRRGDRAREDRLSQRSLTTLEDLYRTIREGAAKILNVVIKADVQGTVQAVRDSLEKLEHPDVKLRILAAGVGPITENDILLAAADSAEDKKGTAIVVGFNVGIASGVEEKAEKEHIDVRTYSVIYALIDEVRAAMANLLDPVYEEFALGKAEVRARFRLPGGRAIAGCYVTDGMIRRGAKARLLRGKDLLYTGEIDTLKRIKDDVREVQSGYECGLTLRDFNDIVEGDVLEVFEMRELPREI